MKIETLSLGPWFDPRACDPAAREATVIINGVPSMEWSVFTTGMYWSVYRNGHHVNMTEIKNLPGIARIITKWETSK